MKFIEVTTKKENKILVNLHKIRSIRAEGEGSIIIFSDIDYVKNMPGSNDNESIYHYESLEIKDSYELMKNAIQNIFLRN